jgi:RNA polymerase sigma factor (TIGR02999 family)
MENRHEQVISLVEGVRSGAPQAAEKLLPLVYEDLRAIAASMLRRERASHTLQPTALVNEAYIKMVGGERKSWDGREHFLAVAAMAMRQILVNHARSRNTQKRGSGEVQALTFIEPVDSSDRASDIDILALDEALQALEREAPRLAKIVELRYFAAMSIQQVAIVLDSSERTINREWRVARAELAMRLREGTDQP